MRKGNVDCVHCNHQFTLSSYELRRLQPQPQESSIPKRPQLKPRHIKVVEDSEKQLKFGYRWFRWSIIFLLLFDIAYFYGFVFMILNVRGFLNELFRENAGFFLNIIIISFGLIIMLASLGFGLAFVYFSLAGAVNRTLITADHHSLTVHHGLIPVQKNVLIEAGHIRQFYVFQKSYTQKGNTMHSYDLCVILQNGEQINLLTKMEPGHAWFIEQKLEKFYGISDLSVNQEFRE